MTPDYPALVLNADFTPITTWPLSVWDMTRAMKNTLLGRVTVLAEYDAVLRSPSFIYVPPSVVALKRYIHRPETVPFTRMSIFLRDNFTCQYCAVEFLPQELTFDHVVPRAAGGGGGFENIVAACVGCNSRKGSRTDMKPIRPAFVPKARDLARKRVKRSEALERSWLDYLYWSGLLEEE